MPDLRLREYVPSRGVALTSDQLRALRVLAQSVDVSPSTVADGTWDLTAGPDVGVVVLDDLTITIEPKIDLDRLMFLVAYVLDPVRWQGRLAEFTDAANPLDAIVAGFVAQLRRALGPGVLHGYRSTDDSLSVVRGRIRFGDQLRRHHARTPPIEVSFDEFTDDIDENRILAAALGRLRRLPLSSRRLRRELHLHHVALATVTPVDYRGNDLPEITWTRLNQRYRGAVELARLILRSTSIERDDGAVHSAALLVNMNRLFEDFVVTALRDHLGVGPSTLVQGAKGRRLHLDEAGHVRLEPDLSWWEDGRCRFVADCKYKRINVAGIKHPDLYQLLAYTTAADLDSGLLIYAAGEAEPRDHVVRFSGKTLTVTAIDLSGDPESILDEVARIAEQLHSVRWRASHAV